VIFIEHKALYAQSGPFAEPPAPVPIGRAAIARPEPDPTVVTWGAALDAIDVEVEQEVAAAVQTARSGAHPQFAAAAADVYTQGA
jgi:pyruvate/2-oxoglutarate/acetoin dehydrogenase E1 component